MPSKSKKQLKMQSKLSHTGQSLSPSTPPSTTSCPDAALSEEELLCSLKEASSKYPCLIGTSAFIGQVTDVASDSKACSIWLSESSMVASSLAPGSIVSVSLVSSRKDFLNGHPLGLLADECAGNNSDDIMANQAGNYFTLATIFSSCKVLKNGVRLSSNLSYTMGSPASGRIVFVYSIQNQSLACSENGNDKLHSAAGNILSLYKCNELYLELAHSSNGVAVKSDLQPIIKFSEEPSNDIFGDQISSSPRTPLRDSKVRSHSTGQLTSSRCEKSASSLSNSRRTSFEPFDVRDVLGDESTKKLLQTCATSWLSSRILLYNNFVTMPILSQLCIFRVIGANRLLTNNGDRNLEGKDGDSLFGQALKSVEHVDDAFIVDSNTKVYLSFPSNLALETPQGRKLPRLNLVYKEFQANMEANVLRMGGVSKEYETLKGIIAESRKNTLSSFGLRPTKGVLLHGPPGTGKTSLARLCAHDAGVNIFTVNGPEIVSQYYGESEKALHEIFDSASQAAPSVVFIDELDAIAAARKDGSEELSQNLVATLLNLMDGICRTDGLLVIAATNRPDSIESALRRPGRFDREIEIGVPSPKQRLDILLTLLSGMDHTLSNAQVQQLAMATHGFVGADLAALCNEAALVCLKRYVMSKLTCCDSSDGIERVCDCSKDIGGTLLRNHSESLSSSHSDFPMSSEAVPYFSSSGSVLECPHHIQDVSDNGITKTCVLDDDMLKVAFEDIEKAYTRVRPSAMREIILEVPKVNWDDVGGQKEVKAQLIEAVEWPQKYQDAFNRIGTGPPTGVLMFGPPGCSKTLLARAVASEAGLNFLAVKGPELFSKWVGESEKAVRSLFAKARHNAPSIIFFDEIDSLAVTRGKENDGISVGDRVMSQLLVELDGLRQRVNVTVIAATNRPDKIDPALLRPGRFDRLLYVGPPSESDREDIFRIHLRKIPCSTDVSIKELASLSKGCTGADISLICRDAAIAALEENLDTSEITMEHLKTAIRRVEPSEIQSYAELSTKFQRLVRCSSETDASKYEPCRGCTHVSIKEPASLSESCTGADISLTCREAAVAALEERVEYSEITMEPLETVIGQVQPSEIQSNEELSAKFQRLVSLSSETDASKCKHAQVDQAGFLSGPS